MCKQEFLAQLQKALSGLPKNDVAERLTFYSEMIEDRMEEGLSEEDAVAAVGSVEDIAAQVIADTPLTKIVKERTNPKRQLSAWEIILLLLGAPLWLPVLVAVISVGIALYASLLSVLIALWAVWVAVGVSALGCALGGIILVCTNLLLPGVALLAIGLFLAGLTIFLFFICKLAAKGTWFLTKKLGLGIKRSFMGKENG